MALTVTGKVEKFVTIIPPRVHLNGEVGQKIERTVSIVQEKKFPFKIKEIKTQKGENIKYKLQESKQNDRVEYSLLIENTKTSPGYYSDMITLTTDSKINPELTIKVYGNIIPPEKEKNNKS